MKSSLVGYVEIFGDVDDVFVLKEKLKGSRQGNTEQKCISPIPISSESTKPSEFRSD